MIVKRLFDILLSGIGLILLAPFMLVIATLIKFDSPGPVFFRQERVGRHGVPFLIHKFRTMSSDAEKQGPQITIGVDRRITRIGMWLRRYKLDELPQLIDVFLGTMSLVGPRPEVPRYVACYPPELRDKVLQLRPGITDLASIEYKDENRILDKADDPEQAYIEQIMPDKLEYYRRYVDNRSLQLDIKIIYKTLLAVVR